jgi:hypothetical protein
MFTDKTDPTETEEDKENLSPDDSASEIWQSPGSSRD